MPDVLIRNVPAEDLALLDEHAARLGVSRTEYPRRRLQQEARRTVTAVTGAPSIPDLLGAATPELDHHTVLHLDRNFGLIADVAGQPVERLRT